MKSPEPDTGMDTKLNSNTVQHWFSVNRPCLKLALRQKAPTRSNTPPPTRSLQKPGLRFRINHFVADPDPAFHFNADPDLAFCFNADPDPDHDPHQSNRNLRPLIYRHSTAPF
jgi:hypothetical protein